MFMWSTLDGAYVYMIDLVYGDMVWKIHMFG